GGALDRPSARDGGGGRPQPYRRSAMSLAAAIDTMDERAGDVVAETRFAVPDMHCAGCIAKIERLLPAQPGISGARVNFSSRTVVVNHDAALAEPDLIRAFDTIGFAA